MKKLAIALALSLVGFGAQAANSVLTADASGTFSYTGKNLGSSFDDYLTIDLGTSSDWLVSGGASGSFTGINFPFLSIGEGLTSLNVEIFDKTYFDSVDSGIYGKGLIFPKGDVSVTFDSMTVAGGKYVAHVWGTAFDFPIGKSHPSYSFALNAVAVPVPEPESYAMLLAGLGIMGALARRRRAA